MNLPKWKVCVSLAKCDDRGRLLTWTGASDSELGGFKNLVLAEDAPWEQQIPTLPGVEMDWNGSRSFKKGNEDEKEDFAWKLYEFVQIFKNPLVVGRQFRLDESKPATRIHKVLTLYVFCMVYPIDRCFVHNNRCTYAQCEHKQVLQRLHLLTSWPIRLDEKNDLREPQLASSISFPFAYLSICQAFPDEEDSE